MSAYVSLTLCLFIKYIVPKEEYCVIHNSTQCHKISHSGIRPFTYTICNTSFTHETFLMSHEIFHSRETSAPLATNRVVLDIRERHVLVCSDAHTKKQ